MCALQNKITENLSTKVRTKTKLKARCAKATLSSKQSNRDYTGKSHNVTKLQKFSVIHTIHMLFKHVFQHFVVTVPSAPPKAITLVDKGPNHLKFTWQPPICGQQNGLIVNYTYILVNSISNETVEDNTVTTMEVSIDDLLPFVDYDFMVRANTEKGSGPLGRLFVKTAEGGMYSNNYKN